MRQVSSSYLRALILAPVLLIAAPAAASTPTDRCDTYIKAAEQPIGWRIACVGDDIGSDTYGVTYLDYRIILIRRGLGEEQTRLTIAHENAHAEAENLFSPATKAWFTQRLGKTLWYDTNDYYGSPAGSGAALRASSHWVSASSAKLWTVAGLRFTEGAEVSGSGCGSGCSQTTKPTTDRSVGDVGDAVTCSSYEDFYRNKQEPASPTSPIKCDQHVYLRERVSA